LVINFYSTSYPDQTLCGQKVLAFSKIVTTQNHRTSPDITLRNVRYSVSVQNLSWFMSITFNSLEALH